MSVHSDGEVCPGCEAKLLQVHPDLADWFRTKIKPQNLTVHISWGYRDAKYQAECVAEGRSKLTYPHSAHNKTKADGTPCATAVDLFVQVGGKIQYPSGLFYHIASAWPDFILWGGLWKTLGDADHMALKDPRPL